MRKIILAALFVIIFSSLCEAQEKLIYAVRFESPERFSNVVYTEVYSIDPLSKKTEILFSDKDAQVRLLPKGGMGGYPADVLVTGGRRVFSHAGDTGGKRELGYNNASIYEISTDGSNKTRKVLDILGGAKPGVYFQRRVSEIFASPDGEKIGYINYSGDNEPYIFIHDTATGKLLHKIDAAGLFAGCYAPRAGWMPDGKRIYFTTLSGDDHITPAECYKKKGTYAINEDGSNPVRIPPGTVEATDFGKDPFLALMKDLRRARLSNNGRYIAFTEHDYTTGVETVWLQETASGTKSVLFTFESRSAYKPFKGYDLGIVGWME